MYEEYVSGAGTEALNSHLPFRGYEIVRLFQILDQNGTLVLVSAACFSPDHGIMERLHRA
jgi:hypothetical protein